MNERKCEAAIWDSLFGATIRCQKNGHYEHKEKWYCKIHHPPTLRAKIEEIDKKFIEQWNAKQQAEERAAKERDEMHRKAAAYDEILAEQAEMLKRALRAEARCDELLEALRLIAALDPVDAARDPHWAACMARAAIAKAEGKGEGE